MENLYGPSFRKEIPRGRLGRVVSAPAPVARGSQVLPQPPLPALPEGTVLGSGPGLGAQPGGPLVASQPGSAPAGLSALTSALAVWGPAISEPVVRDCARAREVVETYDLEHFFASGPRAEAARSSLRAIDGACP